MSPRNSIITELDRLRVWYALRFLRGGALREVGRLVSISLPFGILSIGICAARCSGTREETIVKRCYLNYALKMHTNEVYNFILKMFQNFLRRSLLGKHSWQLASVGRLSGSGGVDGLYKCKYCHKPDHFTGTIG